jgi:hypothetical protein
MKKICLLFAISAFTLAANAQNIAVGAQYSLLTGHGANDNHTSLSGATVFGTYAITDNMSVGTVIHAYGPKKSNYKSGDFAYKATDDVTNISISYELSMGAKGSLVQPYVGMDMGLSTSNHKVEYTTDMNKVKKVNIKQAFVMISPKMGMTIALSKNFGIYTQAQYNFAPGNGGKTVIEVINSKKGNTVFTTEPISKYYNIDTGVYMLLGNIKSILN